MSTTIKPDYGPRGKYQTAKGRLILSTWPFPDGYPWDEELLHSHHRALTTHGQSFANPHLNFTLLEEPTSDP